MSTAIPMDAAKAVDREDQVDAAKAAFLNAHLDMMQAVTGARSFVPESVGEIGLLLKIVDRAAGARQ